MNIVLIAIFVVVVIAILLSVRIVSQTDSVIVERIGKYHRTMRSGLNFLIPLVDRVVDTTSSKDMILSLGKVDCISLDNAVVMADALIVIKVADSQKAIYGVEDYRLSTAMLAAAALRSKLGSLTLDEALTSRDQIKATVQENIRSELEDWGILLRNVEIQEITPSPSMTQSMEEQAAAERARKAAVTRAEGDKTAVNLQAEAKRYATIQEAEGRLEAAKQDALAQVELAQATAKAVEMVGEALKASPEAGPYLLGEKFVENYTRLAESGNTKIVALPSDIMSVLSGFMKQSGK
ncbi:SPFH domain-containing protein [Pseudomonas putida]|uniref:Band 7 domain-containing protein n=1 Tax=Pseudomonas putida TaxID=303 RepID=A0A7V8J590_PSEPU|nr:SPFH domain-containing protein [Pseudomonas putida]KAF0255768.1 hypothetical protein GN299_06665 [Pseudomonas putida]